MLRFFSRLFIFIHSKWILNYKIAIAELVVVVVVVIKFQSIENRIGIFIPFNINYAMKVAKQSANESG